MNYMQIHETLEVIFHIIVLYFHLMNQNRKQSENSVYHSGKLHSSLLRRLPFPLYTCITIPLFFSVIVIYNLFRKLGIRSKLAHVTESFPDRIRYNRGYKSMIRTC